MTEKQFEAWERIEQTVEQQARQILDALIAAGAKFYYHEGYDILYLDKLLCDPCINAELLAVLRHGVGIKNVRYPKKTMEALRELAISCYERLPDGSKGEVNGIPEPSWYTRRLGKQAREWVQAVIRRDIRRKEEENKVESDSAGISIPAVSY